MNEVLLYGHNSEQNIVAVQQFGDNKTKIYTRSKKIVQSHERDFYPFFFLSDEAYLKGFSKKHWLRKLAGDNHFRYLCAFTRWSEMWEAVHFVIDKYNHTAAQKIEHYANLPDLFLQPEPITQFLLQSGTTLFKNMKFDDLHRLQLHIITPYSARVQRHQQTHDNSKRILIIGLSDNQGFEYLIDGKEKTEKAMLKEMIEIIQKIDPDVIEGYNLINFELPYIASLCRFYEIELTLGRDGKPVHWRDFRQYEQRFSQPTELDIPGRHIVDIHQLARNYDFSRRAFENYSLTHIAEYFGFRRQEKLEVMANNVVWYWDNKPEIVRQNALNNLKYIRQLSEILSNSAFYLSQIVPLNYSTILQTGTANKVESLLLREYIRQRHSIPKPQAGKPMRGGYTDIFYTGHLSPILHLDVDSLYPSIIITYSIKPQTDKLNIFTTLLSELTTMRLEAKYKMKKAKTEQTKNFYEAQQLSLKTLINSFYGYLGYSQALFNDYDAANAITTKGRQLLRQIMQEISLQGGKVIEVDTDGVYLVPPLGTITEEDEESFCAAVVAKLPQGINLHIDGRYKSMISYKKKNYALLDYNEKIIIKGSSLTSRSLERYCRNFIHHSFDALLHRNYYALHKLYTTLVNDIINHRLTVEDFARIETLNDSLERYLADVKQDKRNRSAAYEVALSSGIAFKQGDKVSYYITGNEPHVKTFEHCKLAEEWDPNFPDENVPYYLKRLDDIVAKFEIFFTPIDFKKLFSKIPLSEDNFTDITILNQPVNRPLEVEKDETDEIAQIEPKIWLY